MFKKNKCSKCGKKIDTNSNFCSKCGNQVNDKMKKDYGMLGVDDFEREFNEMSNPFFGGNMLGKMLGGAMKMLEKELNKEMKRSQVQTTNNFELYINGEKVDPSKIKITKMPIQKSGDRNGAKTILIKLPAFSGEKKKVFTTLSKKEPSTNVRRLADRVIYEITIPGVKSIEDVSIVPIGESIEVKAVSKTRAYFKSISVNLPILNYPLNKGKLTLELGAKE